MSYLPGKNCVVSMKFFNVLLLIILVGKPWTACHASRKMLMVKMETESKGRLFLIPRKVLTEAVDEVNDMETELILPDDTDDEKPDILINAEKRLKQQKDPLMEALEEQTDEEAKPQNPPLGFTTLPTIRGGDLVPKEDKEEKWVRGPQKREHNGGEALSENDSFSLVTGDKLLMQEGGRSETKKEEAVLDDEKPEKDQPASTEVGEPKGFSSEVSPANTAEMAKEEDGITMIVKDKEDAQTVRAQKEHQASKEVEASKKKDRDKADDTLEAQKLENGFVSEDVNSKSSDVEDDTNTKQSKKKAATVKKAGKGSAAEGYKSNISDDKDLTGEAMGEESIKEETLTDLIERETQGVVKDLDTRAMLDGTRSTKLNANEPKEGEDKVKPVKKSKTSKKLVSEDLQGNASDLEDVIAINEKPAKTRVKNMKDSDIELDVTNFDVGDSVDLQSKPIQAEDTAKVKPKTKKKDKLKTDKKSYKKGEEDSYDRSEQEEKPQGKVKEKAAGKRKEKTSREPKKEEKFSQNDKSSNKAEKKKQTTSEGTREGQLGEGNGGKATAHDVRILEVVDRNSDTPVKGKNVAKEKPIEEEPLTKEKQEEKLEIEVEGIAREAQEKAEEFNSVPKSSSAEGADDEDDEYSEFMQDFSDFSTKFQDTALKVADHLGPNIQKLTDTSKTYFNKANQHITESFSPIVGKQFAPFLASLVSYGLLLVPLVVVILLFEHIRAMLSLQKVLLFVNIYLAAYFATLLLATFIMGEPMTFFYKSSASGYIHLQLLQALGYIIYVILQTIDMASSCSVEACSVKVTVVLQWFVAVIIGFHYYVTIFHRAMALKGPHTNWKIYGIYSTAFLVLCLFARIKRVKKGYVQIGQEDTDKKH